MRTERGDYRSFYANVRDALLKDGPLAVTAKDGARTGRAIELAHRSSGEGRTLSWGDD